MNSFSGVGRVGRDAELREAGSSQLASWALAVDTGYGNNKQTMWLDCSLFGSRGEKVVEHIKKGGRMWVCGELSQRENNGKTYLKLNIQQFEFLDGKKEEAPSKPKSAPVRGPKPAASDATRTQGGAIDPDSEIPFAPHSRHHHC